LRFPRNEQNSNFRRRFCSEVTSESAMFRAKALMLSGGFFDVASLL
jgi:hypothetical protein